MTERPTVLVVDDESALRRLTRLVLQRAGFAVTEAENGQVALEMIGRDGPPDVALVDLLMPAMGGEQFIAEARKKAPQLVAIFVSASPEAREVAERLGVPLISKPYSMAQLVASVRAALAGVQAA